MTRRSPAENIVLELLPDSSALQPSSVATLAASTPLPPELVAALGAHRDAVAELLADAGATERLSATASARLRRELLVAHPYLEMNAREDALLFSVIERAVAELTALVGDPGRPLDEAALRSALRHQEHELRRFATNRLGLDPRARRARDLAGPVVSSQYTPELQLRLLGLDADQLVQPILDLGSGQIPALVDFLADRGYDVVGVDRLVEPGPHRVQQSWFDFELGRDRWGTIISHQAFSLRFVHAHLSSRDLAGRYARRYRALLDALRGGGVLAYAPGLPFIEPHLSSDFGVTRHPIPLPESHVAPAMVQLFEPDGLYATTVERR